MIHSKLTAQTWDAIIVGAGMGGASAAYQLTSQGHRVLLIEKGLSDFPNGTPESAARTEVGFENRLLEGRWPEQISAVIDGSPIRMWPALGCGTGGTTLIYAATLERFSRADFKGHKQDHYDTSWPYSYEELQPYYLQAESLFRVTGTLDPREEDTEYQLLQPPEMGKRDERLFSELKEAGLSPYRLHVGAKFLPGCTECGGHYCSRACKSDAYNCCLKPAMETGNLTIMSETEVINFEAGQDMITGVNTMRHNQTLQFKAKFYVLAAGTLFSPVILSRSQSHHWPKGIGNHSDTLGRNLMFHAADFIAIWSRKRNNAGKPAKAIAFRDFYRHNGVNLGQVQSMGLNAGYGNIMHYLSNAYDQSLLRRFKFLKHLLRIPAYIGAAVFKEATVFSGIVEDYPYRENRVIADPNSPSGMYFTYTKKPELVERVKMARQLLKSKLKKHRIMIVNHEVSLNFGHPCGTCRAGEDPNNSVVDGNCKIHGISNGYITDGSFMPSSGGTNPSLTIAANALRVADMISQRLKQLPPEK